MWECIHIKREGEQSKTWTFCVITQKGGQAHQQSYIYVNLTQTGVIVEQRAAKWENASIRWGCRAFY